jgi:amino acid adenylation domain-containing protein/non-ribosomal peptide synthase protein (TIGR01720 family)
LCADRSIEMVVGILGILKAGGAYLPLDPTYPADRLAFLLEDSAVPVLVTEEHHLGGLKAGNAKIVVLDRDREALARRSDENPTTEVGPEHLAYVIYTSGSTGKPKGVLVTHNNVARLFEATHAWYGFDASDVWTLFHSYAFDFSVWELWGALLYGGRLVVVPYWVSRSPEAFHELLRRERVTVLNQTPSAFRQLIQADLASGAPAGDMALRTVIFGGEALELQSLRPWIRRYGDARPRLINMYGITETTVHVTYRPITLADVDGGAGSVIGIPIPDLQVYVLDPGREPTPIGVTGEMYVGGAGVARGYLNRPELTAERFVRHPFDADPTARLYRTGDLARRLAGGDLEYLGRIDLQVKIRGFRIELGEIESVIGQHPAVRETTVIAREDGPGDRTLVAYVVADFGLPETIEELRTLVRAKLPDYMVPAHFIGLAALPLTPHGKVDRKALPAPDPGRRATGRPYSPPRTPAEETMAGVWASVLRIERVGIDDNFFELGGDSILSIQVVARCRQSGLVVSPRELFKTPTIAALAAGASTEIDLAANEGPVHGAVPLTPIQRWFFEQELTDVHHWNQAFLFETPADLDDDVLERALHEVARHHDALRLRFTQSPSGWGQEYGPEPAGTSITRVDLSAVPEKGRSAAITSRATALASRLNLTDGPLLRAAHFDLGPDVSGRLLLVVHHLVVDGVSWRILLEDLESAYMSLREGRSVTLPGKTTSYGAWAERLAAYASSEAARRACDYWRRVVETDVAPLPIDHPFGDNLEGAADVVVSSLEVEETEAVLRDVPAAYGTQINDVLLTALARCLSVWTGRFAFRIELEGHGREDLFEGVDLTRTVGWFTTIYPVRLEITPGQDDGAALRSMRDQLRKVPDRGMSYGLLREIARAQPLAELIFNYLGQFDQVVAGSTLFNFATESTGAWHSPRARRTHAVEVLVRVVRGRLEIQWIFSPTLHDRQTIERAAASFSRELRGLIRHCRFVVDRLAAVTPNAEDRYPLSPMQRLFHSMEAGSAGLGYEDWRFAIDGEVDAPAMRRAWELLLLRHTILRTAFVEDGAEDPLQVVLRDAPLPWREEDLRGMDASAQEDRVRELCRVERERGFDLGAAPLMRVALVRLAKRRYEMLWATHHLYIDGWSWPVVIGDLSEIYGALCDGHESYLPPACPYGRYVRWLEEGSPDSESFWKEELAGFTAPTPIDLDEATPSSAGSVEPGEVVLTLAASATEALTAFVRSGQTTIAIAVQGAWALLLAHMSGIDDVVLGAAFSGRPAEIPGVEGMVGPCVNNVPVRVSIRADESSAAYVARLQRKQPDLSHHQFAPLPRIQEWAGVPWRLRLFESLIVFQNYVVGDAARRLGREAAVRLIHGPDATNYPLTLVVVPGPEMRLKILYQPDRFTRSRAEELLADVAAVLTAMGAAPEATVRSILSRLPAGTRGRAATIAAQRRQLKVASYAKPGTALEQAVATIWGDLFQVAHVGLDDNFFDLGGHSLLLLEAHRRLRAQVRADLPVVALFQYPTVRSLARFLGGEAGEAKSRGAQDRAQKQKEALSRMKSSLSRKR